MTNKQWDGWFKLHLEQDGHAVILVPDTNAALEAIDAGNAFDLHILDVKLPASTPTASPSRSCWSSAGVRPWSSSSPGIPVWLLTPEFKGRTVLAKPIDFALLRRAFADMA
jgi:hypothetical protein